MDGTLGKGHQKHLNALDVQKLNSVIGPGQAWKQKIVGIQEEAPMDGVQEQKLLPSLRQGLGV